MALLFLFPFALHASVAIAGKRHWPRRLKSCNPPPPLTYVIGLDASKSMTSKGWASAVRFANVFIDFSLQGRSEVLMYYFNGLFVACMCASVNWMVTVLFLPSFAIATTDNAKVVGTGFYNNKNSAKVLLHVCL